MYLSEGNTNRVKKKDFYTSKNAFIVGKFESVTPEEILEIIDFTLIKWYFETSMFRSL